MQCPFCFLIFTKGICFVLEFFSDGKSTPKKTSIVDNDYGKFRRRIYFTPATVLDTFNTFYHSILRVISILESIIFHFEMKILRLREVE